ncbi:hypothetical protein BGX34_004547, partial [Mortierella sp. NVP85]
MPQPRLPLECILSIIRLLSNKHDTDTMASLLCVNKTICAATLPFLYGDCFNNLMHNPWQRSKKDPMVSMQMVRTLLRQVHPQSRLPDILKVACLSPDDETNLESPPPPVFKYGRFLSMIHLNPQSIHFMLKVSIDSPLMEYAATNQLFEKYINEGYIANDYYGGRKNGVLIEALEVDIYQRLTWTLCQDHPENIESLTIPLRDIQRYIDHVHQFTSLSSVKFSIEGIRCIRWQIDTDEWDQHDIEKTERDRFFRGMAEFVQQHTSIHKNILRNVEVPSSADLRGTDQHSHSDVSYTIHSLLPPFPTLRSIDTDWIELLARHTDTNLSHLESMSVMPGSDREWQEEEISELLSRHPPLLSRCRALKHLSVETLGPDMFQWAVLEKKQKEAGHQQERIEGQRPWQHEHHTSDLVPLQSIKISNRKRSPPDQALNDMVFAFSDSLEELDVSDGIRRPDEYYGQSNASRVVLHGQGWNLPRLSSLRFGVWDLKLHFDMDGLQRCHALESLTMQDDVVDYMPRDIRPWSVVHLPQLKKLHLEGSPALHFNVDSLHHSPCLEELTMGMTMVRPDDVDAYYIMPSLAELVHEDSDTEGVDGHESSGIPNSSPPYQSIGRQSRYTWDWHLPNLCDLDLVAVFALIFDLRWLQHLPNLERLRLDSIGPVPGPYKRHITLKDLSRRESDEDGSEEILSDRFIRALKLESIKLGDCWIFEDKVLEILFLTVAPNLCWVTFGWECTGLNIMECVALSRKMARIECMSLPRSMRDLDEVLELGLVPRGGTQDDQSDKKRVKFYL